MSLTSWAGRILIIAPHPDDETLGAGILMGRHAAQCAVLHLTDGCPRDPAFFTDKAYSTPEAYRMQRALELNGALNEIGICPAHRFRVGLTDREVHLQLGRAIDAIQSAVEKFRPVAVFSPPYEGGHPDHDSAALATACVRRSAAESFAHVEYRLYHAGPGGELVTGRFLDAGESEVQTLRLTPEEVRSKAALLRHFSSQQDILGRFAIVDEQFRTAPAYDFAKPPHPGQLLYENWSDFCWRDWRDSTSSTLLDRLP